MARNTLENVLLRTYGDSAPTPAHLEQRLLSSVQQQASEMERQQRAVNRMHEYRMSRRRAIKWVATGSAGIGIVGASMEIIDSLLFGQDAAQSALP